MKQQKNNIEQILEAWGSNQKSLEEAAKELAHEVEFAKYHKQPIIPTNSRAREYLAALLRELGRNKKDR